MPSSREPGELLVRSGVVVFGLGAVAVLAVFVPFLLGQGEDAPLVLDLLALLLPVGLALALLGLLRGARSE